MFEQQNIPHFRVSLLILLRTRADTRLDTTYLDHAGTTVYATSLIDAYCHDLRSSLFGNPHSASPASGLSTKRVEAARASVLKYFNADSEHFDVVFVANATAAIKLVLDSFCEQRFWFGYHKDAHNSVVGVRESAVDGARCFVSNDEVEQWIKQGPEPYEHDGLVLFAYPAQSNMTGHRLPLSWSKQLRESRRRHSQHTFVLLDAASYLTTGRLDLSCYQSAPDFVSLSFYKIFGFPDLGALIVRKSAYDIMRRKRYFGGGTVDMVTAIGENFHAKKTESLHDCLEDGTLPFHSIAALEHALEIQRQLFGTAKQISKHTSWLTAWLSQELASFKHYNGSPVIVIYKEYHSVHGDSKTQGPIVAFSVQHSDGSFVGKSHVEKLSIACGFQLRTGGVCNPGGIASMLQLQPWEMKRNFTEGMRCGDDLDIIGGKPTGIIRVSLGAMTTCSDVRRFAEFVEFFFINDGSSLTTPRVALKVTSAVITPIQGCPAAQIVDDGCAAYIPWNNQWTVIETTTGLPLTFAKLAKLEARINPEQGKLRISCEETPDLFLDLWELPEKGADHDTFDIYTDRASARWLTRSLGVQCALARYRPRDRKTLLEFVTCVLPSCHLKCATTEDLTEHYQEHAMSFKLMCQKKHKGSSMKSVGSKLMNSTSLCRLVPHLGTVFESIHASSRGLARKTIQEATQFHACVNET